MHPGADPVSGKRPQEDSFASRVRQAHVTRQSEKADSLLRRVEPRILSSLREESIRFFRVGSEPCGSLCQEHPRKLAYGGSSGYKLP